MRIHSCLVITAALVLFAVHGHAQEATQNNNSTLPPPPPPNSAFLISPDQFKKLVSQGADMAKKGKKPADVLNKYGKTPSWVRGGHGRASGKVWCLGFDGGGVLYSSYWAARTYEKPAFPATAESTGLYVKELQFDVSLISAPKIGKNEWAQLFAGLAGAVDTRNAGNYANRVPDVVLKSADAAEVRAVKFVLSDDEGNNFAAEGEGQVSSGTMTHTGVKAVETSGTVTTNATGSATVTGPGGTATVNANGYSHSVFTQTEFVPYTSEHQYFQARYDVHFPLFDEHGTPRISRKAKRLTLRIITDAGEQDVEYKLNSKGDNL